MVLRLIDKGKTGLAVLLAVYALNFSYNMTDAMDLSYKEAEKQLDNYKNSSTLYQIANPGVGLFSLLVTEGKKTFENLYK